MAVLDLGKVVPEKGVDYFTESDVNQIVDDVVDEITIPTKVSELENDSEFIDKEANNLTYYTLATNTGSTIELSINSSTYVMTMNLKNAAGTVISTGTVDLPLESVVVNGSYDSVNKKIVLTLQGGSTIDVPVGDLVSGLQSEITSSNKLSSDLVDDTNQTNKFVTTSEKTAWNSKYDKPSTGIPSTDLSSAVQTSLGKADTALQSETYTGTITSVKMNGSTIASSGEADLGTVITQHQDISGKQDVMQYSTVPTASSSNVDKVIQYVGTTDSTYTNGYFYKCVNNGGTYSWENINVQASSGGNTKYKIDGYYVVYYVSLGSYTLGASSSTGENSSWLPNNELAEALTLAKENDKSLCLVIQNISDRLTTYWYGQGSPSTSGSNYDVYSVTNNGGNIWQTRLRIGYTYSSNTFTVNTAKIKGDYQMALGLTNTQSFTPTSNYNPATKKYVDDAVAGAGGQTIQYSTMPTASATNEGNIIQYVGTTTSDYVKGYYYRCVSDGMAIPSYSWERNDTQPSKYLLDGNNLTYFIKSGQYGIETNSLTSQVNVSLPYAELIEAIELAQHYNKKLNLLIIDTSGGNTLVFTSQTVPPTTNTTFELTSKTTSQDGNVWITKLMIAYSYASNHLAITSCKRVGTSLLSIGIRNSQSYDPISDSYNPATAKYAESMTQCVAPAYNKTSSYAVGDYVTRYGALYICNTAIPSGENWNASHWTQTNVATILGNLETALSNITTGNGV